MTIWRGAVVALDQRTGFARAGRWTDRLHPEILNVGFAAETVNNTDGKDGDRTVSLKERSP